MKLVCVLLLAAAAAVAAAGVEGQAEDDLMRTRMDDLEARIAGYRAAQSEALLNATRTAEIRTLVQDVLEDADSRVSVLEDGAPGVTAGWGDRPFLASADGNFFLQVEGRYQWRYVWNRQDDVEGAPGNDTSRGGFENRRVRFILSGHVVDPSITYKLQATHSRDGGVLELEDAYVQKDWDNGAFVRAGQARPPFTREVNVSTFRTTAVERSIAHAAIELGRTQGVEIGWRDERFGLRGMIHDGDGLANTLALMVDTEHAFSARGEWLVAGEWSQFSDFTSWRGGEFGVLFGAGGHFENGEFGTPGEEYEDWRWTVDASAEFSGRHLYGAVGGRTIDPGGGAEEMDILMAFVQGGLFFTDSCEAFARCEWGDDDSDDDLVIVTVGATRFWNKHDLKWTTDVGYAFEGVSSTFASSGAGWREDPPGADGQIVIRSQMQLAF